MLTVYSKPDCPQCVVAKKYLQANGIDYEDINIVKDPEAREFIIEQGHRTVPQIYFNGKLFVEGGYSGLSKLSEVDIRNRMELLSQTL